MVSTACESYYQTHQTFFVNFCCLLTHRRWRELDLNDRCENNEWEMGYGPEDWRGERNEAHHDELSLVNIGLIALILDSIFVFSTDLTIWEYRRETFIHAP